MANLAYFGPGTNIEAAIVADIAVANSQMIGLLNMWQSEPIHNATLAMAARGAIMSLIVDRRMEFLANPRLDELVAAGVEIRLDKHERSIKSQYLNLDSTRIWTGSYLYQPQYKTRYASEISRLEDGNIITAYNTDWDLHYAHSVPYP